MKEKSKSTRTMTKAALRQRRMAARKPAAERVVYLTVRLREEAALRVRSAARSQGITCSELVMRYVPDA
jgi:hypothetical protein